MCRQEQCLLLEGNYSSLSRYQRETERACVNKKIEARMGLVTASGLGPAATRSVQAEKVPVGLFQKYVNNSEVYVL